MFNMMLLINSLHLEQLVSKVNFGFSLYLPYTDFFASLNEDTSIITEVFLLKVSILLWGAKFHSLRCSKIPPVVKSAAENPAVKLPAVSGFAACLDRRAVCPYVLWTGDCKYCADTVATGRGVVAAAQHTTLNSTLQYEGFLLWCWLNIM